MLADLRDGTCSVPEHGYPTKVERPDGLPGQRQVFGSPCRTAERLGRLLHRRGWAGPLRKCPDCA